MTKTTKRALVTSVLSLLICLSMLIGSTFAWFTDSATTGVNTIQSGNLDIELQMSTDNGATWSDAQGQMLNFLKAEGATGETVIWEPGASYKLPQLRIVNKGNLALKYMVIVNGLAGDIKLANVLDVKVNGNEIGTLTQVMTLAASEADGIIHGKLEASGSTTPYEIVMTMQTSAGNEYQNLSMNGLSITVLATQDTVESDSFSTTYDEAANYYDTDQYGNVTINSTEGLIAFAARVNGGDNFNGKTVKLTNNINLAGITWTPIGTANAKFDGVFDGQGYTISNLTVNNAAYAGLFGRTWTAASIENVKLDGVVINTNHFAGAVVGHTYGDVKNCTVTNATITCLPELVGGSYDNGDKAGGIVGWAACGEITGNTVTNTTVRAYRDMGGILGCNNADNTYAVVSGNTIVNVTLYQDSGFDCGKAESELYVGAFTGRNNQNESNNGTATIQKVRTINTAEDLKAFADSVNGGNSNAGRTVILNNDIDLGGALWTPIGQTGSTTFNGIFDGNGKTISNFTVDSTAETDANYASGLFGWIEEHTASVQIKNLTVDSAIIKGYNYAGGIVGYIGGAGSHVISNCSVTNSELSANKSIGGIVAHIAGNYTISGITSTGNTVTGVLTGREFGAGAVFGRSNGGTTTTMSNVNVSGNTISQDGATTTQTSEYYGTSYGTTTLNENAI